MADESGMPSTYETKTTTTSSSSSGPRINVNVDYIKTIPGILKIVEIVLSLITFICGVIWPWWQAQGGAWNGFVSMTSFICCIVWLLLHVSSLISQLPGPWMLIEFIYYCVFTLFFLICGIVAAVRGHWHSSIGATAFFAFATTAVYAVDTFFQFRNWRANGGLTTSSGGGTSTGTTTVTTTETTQQY
ncbi:unnamed protein product [Owenia fusiformis]|uniref:Uncharacterized protein n=1 Tax=Owenia fusiformis TaxID=6347 RepID=A0A8J1Y8E2_OWEFU|nr:unnamed protein product [Owenia fusiformis]